MGIYIWKNRAKAVEIGKADLFKRVKIQERLEDRLAVSFDKVLV